MRIAPGGRRTAENGPADDIFARQQQTTYFLAALRNHSYPARSPRRKKSLLSGHSLDALPVILTQPQYDPAEAERQLSTAHTKSLHSSLPRPPYAYQIEVAPGSAFLCTAIGKAGAP
eukprot:jgi/Tetstr1/432203/TSEL_021659.t1